MKQVNFRIEENQHKKLFDIAWKRRISMNELIRQMIDELDDNKEIKKEEDK